MSAQAPALAALEALPGAKLKTPWSQAPCPAHDDASPSFGWKVADDGAVILSCRAGCTSEAIVAALGLEMRDLFPPKERKPRPRVIHTTEYVIRDAAGEPQAVHVRLDYSDSSKQCPWRLPDADPKDWGLKDRTVETLPLYGSELVAGWEPAAAVLLVEGEKAADALRAVGVRALATVTGAKPTPDAAVLEVLRGRPVTLWPDADADGREHMQRIAKRLEGIAANVTWLEPPDDAPMGWDAADLLALADDPQAALVGIRDRVGPVPGIHVAEMRANTLDRYLVAVHDFMVRYCAFPSEHEPVAIALWVAHTHLVERFDVSPILAVTSAEMRSGKTRVLDCLEMLCPHPRRMVLPSEAVFYTVLSRRPRPTVLLDELDVIFGKKMPEKYEGVRGVLNSGNQVGTPVLRVAWEGRKRIEEEFDVFGAKAVAGIGDPPATVADRSIPVRMRRRASDEVVAKFRKRQARKEADGIAAPDWRTVPVPDVPDVPGIPDCLSDRAMDSWEPLLVIADEAGGGWPVAARHAAQALSSEDGGLVSVGIRLLEDIRVVFGDEAHLTTAALLAGLHALDGSPWGDWYGSPLTSRELASVLTPYRIGPQQRRFHGEKARGYYRQDFTDAWRRYTPSVPDVPDVPDVQDSARDSTEPSRFGNPPYTSTDRDEERDREGGDTMSEVPGTPGTPGTRDRNGGDLVPDAIRIFAGELPGIAA